MIQSLSKWILPRDAVYSPRSGRSVALVVETALNNCKVKMAEVPEVVWTAFAAIKKSLLEINPEYVLYATYFDLIPPVIPARVNLTNLTFWNTASLMGSILASN